MPAETPTIDINAPGQPPANQQPPQTPPQQPPPASPDKGAEGGDGKSKKASSALSAMVGAFVNDTRASEKPKQADKQEGTPGDKPEDTQTPPAKPAPQGKAAPQAPKKTAPKVTAVKPVAQPPPQPPSMTPEQIAAVAEGAARAIVQKQQPAGQDDGPKLSEGSEYRLKVLGQMEQLFPEKYRGVSEAYKQQLVELMNYATKWQEEHPGEDFNEEDPEHADFMAAHDVIDWEDHHFRKAEVRLEAEELISQRESKVNEKLSEIEKKEKLREAEPELMSEQMDVARTYWQQLGDEFKAAFNEQGHMDPTKFQALAQSDPNFGLRLQAANNLKMETAELYKIMNGFAQLDKENPIHAEMARFTYQCEKDLMQLPPENRLRGGKPFMPAAEYWKATPQQRENAWTFSHRDFAEMRADDLARKVQAEVKKSEEQFRMWAAKRGIQLPTGSENQNPATEQQTQDQPVDSGVKPESPSAVTMPRLAAGKAGASSPAQKPVDAFASRFLS